MDTGQPDPQSRLRSYTKLWQDGYVSTPQEEASQRLAQACFLKSQGPRPVDAFLDLGCGYLRGTIELVDYLEDGHFYGIDISRKNIEKARERALRVCRHRPHLAVADSFEIGQIWPNARFDYILAASLFTHLYPADLQECLRQVSIVLSGRFFATIFKDNTVDVCDGWCGTCIDHQDHHTVSLTARRDNYANLNFCYNTTWIAKTGKDYSLRVREIGSTEIGQFMLEISRISE